MLDLAGNLSEWARDRWSRLSEPFWNAPGALSDPVADLPSGADPRFVHVARAGNWTHVPYSLRAGYREGSPESVSSGVGFRCARPAH